MKRFFAAALVAIVLAPAALFAHCQVPCGIYDDTARINLMLENTQTIEKAVKSMEYLVNESDILSANQMIRWVANKESHASDIISIMSEYFLAQKVKPVAPDADGYDTYLKKLADHHAVITAAMKAKQVANMESVTALRASIETLKKHYNYEDHHH